MRTHVRARARANRAAKATAQQLILSLIGTCEILVTSELRSMPSPRNFLSLMDYFLSRLLVRGQSHWTFY